MKRFLILIAIGLALTACAANDTDGTTPVEPDGGIGDGAGPPPDTGGPFPVADLLVTVEHPDADPVEYRISCLGDTATITGLDDLSPDAACTRLGLAEVQQRLVSPPLPGELVCTEIYGGPDTARIEGTLDEQPVNTTIDRTNGCGISDWDNLLMDVLPAAIGVTE